MPERRSGTEDRRSGALVLGGDVVVEQDLLTPGPLTTSSRDDAVSAPLLEGDGHEEAGGELASDVFKRRHRDENVLAEERDDRLDVARLECSGEPLDELPFRE